MEAMPRKIQEYLDRAGEAEERARNASNDIQKAHWRDIANAYRNLAQVRLIDASPLDAEPEK